MTTNARDFFVRFLSAIDAQDYESLETMIHPEFQGESPQSSERSHAFAGFRAQMERYPGGPPSAALPEAQLIGDEERWAITPSYTVVPLAGKNDYTVLLRLQYPDGNWWRMILLIQLRDDRLFRMESYFAPELEAPLLAKIGGDGRG